MATPLRFRTGLDLTAFRFDRKWLLRMIPSLSLSKTGCCDSVNEAWATLATIAASFKLSTFNFRRLLHRQVHVGVTTKPLAKK